MRKGLTYADVLIIPTHSGIESRSEIDVSSWYLGGSRLPIISAPMDYVTGLRMGEELSYLGAYGIINRFTPAEKAYSAITGRVQYGAAIGTKDWEESLERITTLYPHSICVDVAHGHHENVRKTIEKIKYRYPYIPVIAGNVATADGFKTLADAGADAIRVGIGAGSVCSTRENTGVGVPQLTAIMDCYEAKISGGYETSLIADGGIQNPGDIAKALAAGADAVMLGKMLAGHDESPGDILDLGHGKYKKYRGQSLLGTNAQRNAPEGVEGLVEYKGPVKNTIDSLMHYLRSSMSYVGARNLTEFRERAEFIKVSPSTIQENNTRI